MKVTERAKRPREILNRKIVRTASSDTRHYYYNRQWQVLVEATGSTSTPVAKVIYSYHPGYVDAIAHRMTDTDCHVYLADANYNVTAMLDATDRTSPSVVERYSYTPYGVPTVLDSDFSADADNTSDIGNTYLYTGRWRDPNTNLQLNRNRWFDSQLGRWLTRDPIGYEAGFNNLYEYVSSRPIYYVDSTGEKPTLGSNLDPDGDFDTPGAIGRGCFWGAGGFILGGPLGGGLGFCSSYCSDLWTWSRDTPAPPIVQPGWGPEPDPTKRDPLDFRNIQPKPGDPEPEEPIYIEIDVD